MSEGPQKLRLSEFLPYRLSVLSNRISRAIADSYEARFQLSLPEWRVMAVLAETPEIAARDVARRTAMDKVAVSRAVGRLIASGRVERHRAEDDKRRSVLALSDRGQQVYAKVAPLALAYEDRLLAGLSAEERALLTGLLDRLDQLPVSGEVPD